MRYAADHGIYVRQDYAKAVEWLRQAALRGHNEAQRHLGDMYDQGEGVRRSAPTAVMWYRMAAEQGDARAQYDLGEIYHDGRGVPQDYAKAVKWFRMAGEQRYTLAQVTLGEMYKDGRGVPQDYAEAFKWFRMAAEHKEVTTVIVEQINHIAIARVGWELYRNWPGASTRCCGQAATHLMDLRRSTSGGRRSMPGSTAVGQLKPERGPECANGGPGCQVSFGSSASIQTAT